MGLDKWLKPDDIPKKSKKKGKSSEQVKKSKGEYRQEKTVGKRPIKLTKFVLVCPNAKCKYQKTIMKKNLSDDDKNCPRCNKKMKAKEV